MALIWHVARTPAGALGDGDLTLRETADTPLRDGEVRVRNLWLSVDPFVRDLMDPHGEAPPVLPPGAPMPGAAVGEVIESRARELREGVIVLHDLGWRDRATLPAARCRRIDDSLPPQLALGHLGIAGQTAYFGLLAVGAARPGETLFVSAAAGAVGSAVVQIGRLTGLTVIASAGGADKCALLRELGADAVLDRAAPGTMRAKLAAAAPDGIDLAFDNVGGDHLDAAIESARVGARIVLCGMIAGYGHGAPLVLPEPMRLIAKQLRLTGFVAPAFDDRRAEFEQAMRGWSAAGLVRSPETVAEGLPAMPAALVRVLDGGNVGKMLVRL